MGIIVGVIIVILLLVILPMSIKIVQEYERGVVFRWGRLVPEKAKTPGLIFIIPFVDRMVKVDLRVVTLDVPSQEVITKDNVTIKVNAVVYFRVENPVVAVVAVANYVGATVQIALTTLRSVLGQSELDEVLAHRDQINEKLRHIIDEQTEKPWGVKVTVAEVKDVLLPEVMQRSMASQAEAERERRAKVVHAEGEHQAAKALALAADIIAQHPVALQLRYLQTMAEMASERTSTIIPIPLDLFDLFRNLRDRSNGSATPQVGRPDYEASAVAKD